MTKATQDVECAGQAGAGVSASQGADAPLANKCVRSIFGDDPRHDGLTALLVEKFDLAMPDDVPFLLLQAPLIAHHILYYLDKVAEMKQRT